MNAPLPPDELTAENELICEKLLGWNRWQEPGKRLQWQQIIDEGRGWFIHDLPSFTAWAEAGLILDALRKASIGYSSTPSVYAADKIIMDLGERLQRRLLGPPCIRDAALRYIRSLP